MTLKSSKRSSLSRIHTTTECFLSNHCGVHFYFFHVWLNEQTLETNADSFKQRAHLASCQGPLCYPPFHRASNLCSMVTQVLGIFRHRFF